MLIDELIITLHREGIRNCTLEEYSESLEIVMKAMSSNTLFLKHSAVLNEQQQKQLEKATSSLQANLRDYKEEMKEEITLLKEEGVTEHQEVKRKEFIIGILIQAIKIYVPSSRMLLGNKSKSSLSVTDSFADENMPYLQPLPMVVFTCLIEEDEKVYYDKDAYDKLWDRFQITGPSHETFKNDFWRYKRDRMKTPKAQKCYEKIRPIILSRCPDKFHNWVREYNEIIDMPEDNIKAS